MSRPCCYVIVIIVVVGELVAECNGPSQMAYCTLIDRQDGTYELKIKAQETGSHKLKISYGCEPVPGVSFILTCIFNHFSVHSVVFLPCLWILWPTHKISDSCGRHFLPYYAALSKKLH